MLSWPTRQPPGLSSRAYSVGVAWRMTFSVEALGYAHVASPLSAPITRLGQDDALARRAMPFSIAT